MAGKARGLNARGIEAGDARAARHEQLGAVATPEDLLPESEVRAAVVFDFAGHG